MTHKFGDESGGGGGRLRPLGCVAAADNSAPQPEQTRTQMRASHQSLPGFTCQSRSESPSRPPAGWRGRWWWCWRGGLFVPEHHRVCAANKLLLCNLTLSGLIPLTRPEVKSNGARLYKERKFQRVLLPSGFSLKKKKKISPRGKRISSKGVLSKQP